MSEKNKSIQLNECEIQDIVIDSSSWLTATELASLFHVGVEDCCIQLEHWKAQKQIFSVEYRGNELYPTYAFDEVHGCRPIKGLQLILQLFGDSRGSWGLAYWFAGVNGYLGGARPLDLLSSNPELVLVAAKWKSMGIQHG